MVQARGVRNGPHIFPLLGSEGTALCCTHRCSCTIVCSVLLSLDPILPPIEPKPDRSGTSGARYIVLSR